MFDKNTKLFELPLKQMGLQQNSILFEYRTKLILHRYISWFDSAENMDVFVFEYLDRHKFQMPLR
jgi:hypothetical protein